MYRNMQKEELCMTEIRYNLNGLQQYANQMAKFLPQMLEKEQWPEIEWIISVPNDVWNGESAEEYRILCRQIINSRDTEKVKKIFSKIKWSNLDELISAYLYAMYDDRNNSIETVQKLKNKIT